MSETYRTQNLYEAAYLLTKGAKIRGKIRSGKKIILEFEAAKIKEIAMGFYNGDKVQAKQYADNYRNIKDYVFERSFNETGGETHDPISDERKKAP